MKQTASIVLSAFAAGLLMVSAAQADSHTEDQQKANECTIDADVPVDGTVKGSVTSIGFMVGARWGEGVLTLPNGQERRFNVFGVKAFETGAATGDFEGEVYRLKDVEDFPGTFYGSSTGLTLVKGKGEAFVNNARCVFVKIRTMRTGAQLSAPAPGGVEITWD